MLIILQKYFELWFIIFMQPLNFEVDLEKMLKVGYTFRAMCTWSPRNVIHEGAGALIGKATKRYWIITKAKVIEYTIY